MHDLLALIVEPERILVQAPTVSYTLTGLLAYTEYQFSVRAATVENDVDLWGNFSNMAVTRTEAAGTWSVMLYEGDVNSDG